MKEDLDLDALESKLSRHSALVYMKTSTVRDLIQRLRQTEAKQAIILPFIEAVETDKDRQIAQLEAKIVWTEEQWARAGTRAEAAEAEAMRLTHEITGHLGTIAGLHQNEKEDHARIREMEITEGKLRDAARIANASAERRGERIVQLQRAVGRIEGWSRNFKWESKSAVRNTMKLIHDEAHAALVTFDWK